MQRESGPEVLLTMVPAGFGRDREHELLVELVADLLGEPVGALSLRHCCPECGSTAHGAPSLVGPTGQHAAVSLSRSAGHTLLAAAAGCTGLGVDLESSERVALAEIDSVAFSTRERDALARLTGPAALRMRTLAWTAKEALLKAAGTGLTTDPDRIDLELAGPEPRLVDGAAAGLDPARTHLACYSRGDLLVSVATVADRAPRIRWLTDTDHHR